MTAGDMGFTGWIETARNLADQAAWRTVAWAIAACLAWILARFVLIHMFLPMARRTRTHLDVAVLGAVRPPLPWAAAFAVLHTGARRGMVGMTPIPLTWSLLEGACYTGLVVSVAWLIYGALRAFTEWYRQTVAAHTRTTLDDQFIALFRRVGRFVVVFLAVAMVLDHFGVKITALLATAGIASLAVALAAQETLANMISGLALMADRPFHPGDRVQLADGSMGDVLEIGMRSTRILSFDNTVLTIPNSVIAKNQITNFNAPTPAYKIRATIGVAYATDVRQVKAILLDLMRRHPEVLPDPPPAVYFTEFAASALNLLYVCWVADYREQFRIRDELNMSIKDRFEAEGIEIPFPQRVVHMTSRT